MIIHLFNQHRLQPTFVRHVLRSSCPVSSSSSGAERTATGQTVFITLSNITNLPDKNSFKVGKRRSVRKLGFVYWAMYCFFFCFFPHDNGGWASRTYRDSSNRNMSAWSITADSLINISCRKREIVIERTSCGVYPLLRTTASSEKALKRNTQSPPLWVCQESVWITTSDKAFLSDENDEWPLSRVLTVWIVL